MNAFRPFYTYPMLDTALGFKPVLVPSDGGYRWVRHTPQNPFVHLQLIAAAEAARADDAISSLRVNGFSFPYLLSAFRFLRSEGLKPSYRPPGNGEEARRRLGWVLDRFRDDAVARGIVPVILLMPMGDPELSLDHVPGFKDLSTIIRKQTAADLLVIDAVREWRSYSTGKEGEDLGGYRPYLKKSHPSETGNKWIASVLLRSLCSSPRVQTDARLHGSLCEGRALNLAKSKALKWN